MQEKVDIKWQTLSFFELDNKALYQIIKLRIDVFVVEQECPYPELDDKDHHSGVRHLIGRIGEEIAVYCRVLEKGLSYPSPSIGRVIVAKPFRSLKLGHQLLEEAINTCESLWPEEKRIEIGAQYHLEEYYQRHGFKQIREMYLEDGIPHIDMVRQRQ
ncbi:GNAT family N-acetyltransferase [Vibrio sp. FNV 38]|nr:GNAT family N-acetyltransferase [Vibrio sp. FNV 38]